MKSRSNGDSSKALEIRSWGRRWALEKSRLPGRDPSKDPRPPMAGSKADDAEMRRALATESRKESPVAPIVCYCLASILMTVVNKYVVSGPDFSMTFCLLAIQSTVCSATVLFFKFAGVISFRDFAVKDAKAWMGVSFMLVNVIYTGSKSLQFLTIPVYTIFKNLTIILIAYGEVLWFGGRVTSLTLISFLFMVRNPFSSPLTYSWTRQKVISSIIAAWDDVAGALADYVPSSSSGISATSLQAMQGVVRGLNLGYFWMAVNCLSSAAYVLLMRKRIKSTGFSDWDSMFYNNLLSIPVLATFSFIFEDWGAENLAVNFPPETRRLLLSTIAFSGAAAVGISYTTAWCVRATSSTTYSMVGALNKLPVALSGLIFFGNRATFGSVLSIAVGFVAGLLYAVAKNNQKKAETRDIIPLTARR
ncbi:GDP-mannose transporter [Mycena chlorophos]|uniref:GDP-mannose transporter n=1 Tax=Mycena chlorophos TaxID=658473 RepID=A0A8H6RXB8_MYCCL|nr:GDP-mannose transporter [Mycena chlorophos]